MYSTVHITSDIQPTSVESPDLPSPPHYPDRHNLSLNQNEEAGIHLPLDSEVIQILALLLLPLDLADDGAQVFLVLFHRQLNPFCLMTFVRRVDAAYQTVTNPRHGIGRDPTCAENAIGDRDGQGDQLAYLLGLDLLRRGEEGVRNGTLFEPHVSWLFPPKTLTDETRRTWKARRIRKIRS